MSKQLRVLHRALNRLVRASAGRPDGVARFLHEEGVTGRRGSSCSCPVAEYLTRETNALWSIYVSAEATSDTGAIFHVDLTLPDGTYEVEALPEVVNMFINMFDGGSYPYLERP